jgi:hypothetical protein
MEKQRAPTLPLLLNWQLPSRAPNPFPWKKAIKFSVVREESLPYLFNRRPHHSQHFKGFNSKNKDREQENDMEKENRWKKERQLNKLRCMAHHEKQKL